MTRILVILMAVGSAMLAATAHADFDTVTGPCGLRFPHDHGAHPGYRTEWWYWTGNLSSDTGRRFGFQLTFFRNRITVPGEKPGEKHDRSAWRADHIYMAHAAVSDISENRYYFDEEMARGALDMAGAVPTSDGVRIFLKEWSAQIGSGQHRLRADTGAFAMDLKLTPLKPPALHGDDGYSRKGDGRGRASCYYSFTRLKTEGTLRVGRDRLSVVGSGWMDQEFSTALLEPGISGWDWFGLQLSDNTELMIFLLRKTAGGIHRASGGTHVLGSGATVPLTKTEFEIRTGKTWESPRSGAVYPARWRILVPSLDTDITVLPRIDDQEASSAKGIGTVYWEGSVTVTGTKDGKPVTGNGYVELTGYDKPFDAPL